MTPIKAYQNPIEVIKQKTLTCLVTSGMIFLPNTCLKLNHKSQPLLHLPLKITSQKWELSENDLLANAVMISVIDNLLTNFFQKIHQSTPIRLVRCSL